MGLVVDLRSNSLEGARAQVRLLETIPVRLLEPVWFEPYFYFPPSLFRTPLFCVSKPPVRMSLGSKAPPAFCALGRLTVHSLGSDSTPDSLLLQLEA